MNTPPWCNCKSSSGMRNWEKNHLWRPQPWGRVIILNWCWIIARWSRLIILGWWSWSCMSGSWTVSSIWGRKASRGNSKWPIWTWLSWLIGWRRWLRKRIRSYALCRKKLDCFKAIWTRKIQSSATLETMPLDTHHLRLSIQQLPLLPRLSIPRQSAPATTESTKNNNPTSDR